MSAELPSFDRKDIEAAMDAYNERPRANIQYWVRSTRKRPDRVYPSKRIAIIVSERKGLRIDWGHNAGWLQKQYAAALLHNSGFIIVDRGDTPITWYEKLDHLIRGAERIRLCAMNYYIEPARERGAGAVSVRANDLARDMGLENAFPSICSALGGKKLQEIASVPAPTCTEPNPSSSTTFTYQLAGDSADAPDEEDLVRNTATGLFGGAMTDDTASKSNLREDTAATPDDEAQTEADTRSIGDTIAKDTASKFNLKEKETEPRLQAEVEALRTKVIALEIKIAEQSRDFYKHLWIIGVMAFGIAVVF